MSRDVRESRSPVSGFVEVEPEDDDYNEVLELRPSETLAPDYIRLQYSDEADENTTITLYDRDEDDGRFGESPAIDTFIMHPGDSISITDATYDDVHSGVSAEADGDNDAELIVAVGGMKVTG